MPVPQELLQGFHSLHVHLIEVVVVSSLDSVGSTVVVVFSVDDFVKVRVSFSLAYNLDKAWGLMQQQKDKHNEPFCK